MGKVADLVVRIMFGKYKIRLKSIQEILSKEILIKKKIQMWILVLKCLNFETLFRSTICPRSSYPFYILTYSVLTTAVDLNKWLKQIKLPI